VDSALKYAIEKGLCMAGKEVIVLTSTSVTKGEHKHATATLPSPLG